MNGGLGSRSRAVSHIQHLVSGFINTRAFQKVSFLLCKVEPFLTVFKLENNSILATENLKNIERRHKEIF